MLLRSRYWLCVLALLTFVPLGSAQGGKSVPPVVPGFVRFYADDKADAVKGGHLLFNELSCGQCHASSVPARNDAAPVLDGVGGRLKRSYVEKFLGDPHGMKPGTKMPDLFVGLDNADKKAKVEALSHYLASTGVPSQIRPDRKSIGAGRDLYSKVGCVACHGTRDAKGEADKLFATSVPLADLNAKYSLSGLKSLLENPHQTRPNGKMPGLLNAKEANEVANYLLQNSTVGMSNANMKYWYYEGAWKNLPDFDKLKPITSGEASDFELSVARRTMNCGIKFEGYLRIETDGNYSFHTTSDDGSKLWVNDKVVVNNDGIHAPQTKSGKVKLTKGTHKITVGVFNGGAGFELGVEFDGPGTGRQALGPRIMMTEEPEKKAAVVKEDVVPIKPELVATGKELFVSMGCANCHALNKEAKRIDAPAEAGLNVEAGCLAATPKKGTPWFALSAVQKNALKAALKRENIAAKDTKAVAQQRMMAFNCYACHDRDKIGGVEEDLNKHFQTVMPEMGDEGRIPPSLNGVAAKMNLAYLKKIVDQGSHDRPYMHTRMPKFANEQTTQLVDMFVKLDTPEQAPKVELKEAMTKYKAAARHMVGPQAFGCIKCHTFAGNKAEGVQGMDLAIMTQRLQRDWFHNYMTNPAKYRPGTRMPASFPDGTTPLKNILDGKADTQLEAMWVYLSDGKAATMPFGINKASIPLIPQAEAIIYRNFIQGAGARAIGVGFPERAHLAFDANDIRLAMIWQGAFIDAKRHWTDRGVGYEPPSGDNVWNLPTGASFYVLGKADEAWPTKSPKELGYKFRGYTLTEEQRPTFLYSFNEIKIDDTPNAIETKSSPTLRRSFTITTDNPIDKLYYRAAVADKIEADKDGWYRVNDYRVRIESAATPVIRQAGAKMELLVPVQFKGNSAKIVQEYVW